VQDDHGFPNAGIQDAGAAFSDLKDPGLIHGPEYPNQPERFERSAS
jgi:hypothetical protein